VSGAIEKETSDAATAIQYAIDELGDEGGLIFLKKGEYEIKSTINLKSNIAIVGEQGQAYHFAGVTRLKCSAPAFSIGETTYKEAIRISNLALISDPVSQDYAIRIIYSDGPCNQLIFENLLILYFKKGIWFKNNGGMSNAVIRDAWMVGQSNGDPSIHFQGSGGVTVLNCHLDHVLFSDGDTGIEARDSNDRITFVNVQLISHVSTVGMKVEGSYTKYVTLIGGNIEGYSTAGILVDSAYLQQLIICNTSFYQGANPLIRLASSTADGNLRIGWDGITKKFLRARIAQAETFNLTKSSLLNKGRAVLSGDGVTTEFTLGAHGIVGLAGLEERRVKVIVVPESLDAIAASPCVGYVDPAAKANIKVKFASAPAAGTGNVIVRWFAENVWE